MNNIKREEELQELLDDFADFLVDKNFTSIESLTDDEVDIFTSKARAIKELFKKMEIDRLARRKMPNTLIKYI